MKSPPSSSTERPLNASAIALVLLLCLTWGFNQVAVKLVLPDIPPLTQAGLRSFGGLIIILLVARWRRVPLLMRDGTLAAGLFAGVLFGIEVSSIRFWAVSAMDQSSLEPGGSRGRARR